MRTPLNYTGNKSRLVPQFRATFPEQTGVFVDLFCGGASVGLSVNAKEVIFVDSNPHIIGLLKHLASYDYKVILGRLESLIDKHHLSYSAKFGYKKYRQGVEKGDNNGLKKYNQLGFYSLRDAYNSQVDKFSPLSLDMLYLLIVYGFNNDVRFNSRGHYNLPVGKTDLNNNNLKKLEKYTARVKEISCRFICGDFRTPEIRKILLSADFVYADPPYLLSDAVYNERGGWTENEEVALLHLLTELCAAKIKFALSNVISKERPKIENKFLRKFVDDGSGKDLRVVGIDYHYRSSSYNKKSRDSCEEDVLVVNF